MHALTFLYTISINNKIDSQKKEEDYMKNPTKKIEIQKRTLFLLCSTIVVLLIRIGTDAVLQRRVKNSADLVMLVTIDQSFENLIEESPEVGKKMFQTYERFFDNNIEGRYIQQYTVIKNSDGERLLIRTTPGTVNHQLYIQDVKVLDADKSKE